MNASSAEVAPLEFVDLHGYRMAYRQWGEAGESATAVLIHGITSSSLSWVRVAPRLAQHRRVIAVDLKGHGDSDRPSSGYRLADQANEVGALCSALELGQVCVVGHSWGGAIALQLAARGSVPIRRLVLEDPAIGQPQMRPDQEHMRRQAVARYIESVGLSREEAEARARADVAPGWTDQDVAGKIDAAMKGSRAAVEAVFVENGSWSLIDLLPELRCQTLLVRAEVARGGIVGQQAVARAESNPLIRVVTIPMADHNIHRGHFEAFMAEVEPFIEGACST